MSKRKSNRNKKQKTKNSLLTREDKFDPELALESTPWYKLEAKRKNPFQKDMKDALESTPGYKLEAKRKNPFKKDMNDEPTFQSTPWHKFKDEINANNMKKNNDEKFNAQKRKYQDDRNKKILEIKEKQKEETQWETFGKTQSSTTLEVNSIKEQSHFSRKQRFVKGTVFTPKENDYLRKVITRTTMVSAKPNLKRTLEGLADIAKKLRKT